MKNDYFNTFESGDIEIRKDIELNIEHSNLFVVMEDWFDVDKKFGINVNDKECIIKNYEIKKRALPQFCENRLLRHAL